MNRLVARLRGRRANSEDGFTLVELIISIVLLTLVTGALSAAFVTSLNSSANSSQRVRESNDAQIIAAYLVRDAQAAGGSNPLTGQVDSAYGVMVNGIAGAGVTDPDPTCNSSGTLIARFAWADRVDTSTTHVHLAKYYYVPAAGSVPGQLVRLTCLDGSAQAAVTLGRRIGSSPAEPVATCTPAAQCPGLPDTVQMTLSEDNNPVTNTSGPYTYTLTASLRPSSDVPPLTSTNSESVPMLALGGGDCSGQASAAGLDYGGSSTTKVYGGVAVNGGGTSSCPAVDTFGAAYTYNAAGLPQNTAIGDPYAGLPTPAGTCPPGGGVNPAPVGGVYQPGVYPQALPANASLAAGVFVLCASAPSGLHGDGVMLYLAKGTVTWTGNNTILSAASSGPYAGIVLWQPASNSATFTVQGNAGMTLSTATPAVSPPLGSVLYAPTAEVDLTGTADLFLGGLVAKTIYITGNHQVVVGVPPATLPSITNPSPGALPDGVVGGSYSVPFQSTGGSGVNVWSATGLPPGLSLTQITTNTARISGTPNPPPGTYNPVVTVTDNLGDVAQQAYTLTINAQPTVSSTNPTCRSQGTTSQVVTINGTGFQSGAVVTFSGPGIAVSAPTSVAATQIMVNVTITAGATPGARDVTVTNPDGGSATGNGAFSVVGSPGICGVKLVDGGGTAGMIQKGDEIVVTFSEQMRVSSFCSTWSNDSNNQSLAANGAVVVTVSDGGAGNDSVGVQVSSCPLFNLGSIDLGSGGYVSGGNATFSGNNANKSTIAWDAVTDTLTIKLGNKSGGAVGAVASSTPTYSASALITNSSGIGLTNSPFTLPPGNQF